VKGNLRLLVMVNRYPLEPAPGERMGRIHPTTAATIGIILTSPGNREGVLKTLLDKLVLRTQFCPASLAVERAYFFSGSRHELWRIYAVLH